MAKVNINTLKNWFKTGLKPTQQQFWDTWDSYWHKDQKIPIKTIDGLADLIAGKADSAILNTHITDPSAHGIDKKVDKIHGKGLSTEDFTTEEKEKLAALDFTYTSPSPTTLTIGGVPAGTLFDKTPISKIFDQLFYVKARVLTIKSKPSDATILIDGIAQNTITTEDGRSVRVQVSKDNYVPYDDVILMDKDKKLLIELIALTATEIAFTISTTEKETEAPIVLLRTLSEEGYAEVNYGDGVKELIKISPYKGSISWADNEGITHEIDDGNTYKHRYAIPGDYEVTIKTSEGIYHARFCESLNNGDDGYLQPKSNAYITAFHKFKSAAIEDLNYTFGGLVNCTLDADFVLETPEVSKMEATFHSFGLNIKTERWSFPKNMLKRISKPKRLGGTFYKSGLRKIEIGFFDSLTEVTSLWECFKNSKLGHANWAGKDAGAYSKQIIDGSDDFLPVSLFWNMPKLKDVSHTFNYIAEGHVGNLSSGYLAFLPVRRELFWNGKSKGNKAGTITEAFYMFGKANRLICEPNILKHAPDMRAIGGIFTQTNSTRHDVGWGTMYPVASSETEVYNFSKDKEGNFITEKAPGKGLTNDLNIIFPAATYPKITCITGAFTCAVDNKDSGFNHPLDYTAAGLPVKLDQKLDAKIFLAKFPKATAGSIDKRDLMLLGQNSESSDEDAKDGSHGVFYKLNQVDGRILNDKSVPELVFKNAIPY